MVHALDNTAAQKQGAIPDDGWRAGMHQAVFVFASERVVHELFTI